MIYDGPDYPENLEINEIILNKCPFYSHIITICIFKFWNFPHF